MRTLNSLMIALVVIGCVFSLNASTVQGQGPNRTKQQRAEIVAGVLRKVEKLKIENIDLQATAQLVNELIDLPLPTLGYDAFNIPNKDGSPLKTQVKIGAVTFNSDGQTAIIGSTNVGTVILAPEGSSGFGSNKKDMVVLFIGYDAEKKAFEDPVQVVGKLSEMYKPNSEYFHGSANAGFLLVVPKGAKIK